MRTTPTEYMDLLPQMDTYCTSPENNLCFLGGDGRVNLHPLITTQYTLFVREHNRLANLLGATYPDFSDEILFQEARKFLIAEFQHIANNEFLPNILGSDLMEAYNLWSLQDGHSSYLSSVHPGTRNGFASAAFLFAHSGVMGEISINGSQISFGSLFYNPDIFYNVSDATTILFMTDELTNKLSETKPGDGWDLAAINIQSGRDNGLPTYNTWRHWCGLNVAENFTSLVDHKDEDKEILQQIYDTLYLSHCLLISIYLSIYLSIYP
ncbi:PXDN [Acanthosepion pharaonis]|uniref:PXDN n=1 Tax=Acanthosepion pharaonis TaxID=158019 RepID=A0A812E0X2_ACAPH|nr:PXDN [Sepia pharaonis]